MIPIDLIAQYKEQNDELILHWSTGKKTAFEWAGADDKYLPPDSIKFGDGKAIQTKFQRNKGNN